MTKILCENCSKPPASIFDRPGRKEEIAATQRDIDLRIKHARENREYQAAKRKANAKLVDERTKAARARAGKAAKALQKGG